jgi:hypothetical protein
VYNNIYSFDQGNSKVYNSSNEIKEEKENKHYDNRIYSTNKKTDSEDIDS